MVALLATLRIVHPSQSVFLEPMVIVHKKESSWHMYPYYRELNKMTINDKFLIHVNDELLDELQREIVSTNLDLHSRYHLIKMRQ